MYFKDSRIEKLLHSAEVITFDMNGLLIDDESIQLQSMNQILSDY